MNNVSVPPWLGVEDVSEEGMCELPQLKGQEITSAQGREGPEIEKTYCYLT